MGELQNWLGRAIFVSGLIKVETKLNGIIQSKWRPRAAYHYIQDYRLRPDVVVDITAYQSKKMESIMAFKSQFYDPNSSEPESPISSKEFLDYVEAADRVFGRLIGVPFAEGFNVRRPVGVKDLVDLI